MDMHCLRIINHYASKFTHILSPYFLPLLLWWIMLSNSHSFSPRNPQKSNKASGVGMHAAVKGLVDSSANLCFRMNNPSSTRSACVSVCERIIIIPSPMSVRFGGSGSICNMRCNVMRLCWCIRERSQTRPRTRRCDKSRPHARRKIMENMLKSASAANFFCSPARKIP